MIVLGWIAAFARFWYRFIIGDDWTVAAAVCSGLALAYVLSRSGLEAWWLMPPLVIAVLCSSLWRARRRA